MDFFSSVKNAYDSIGSEISRTFDSTGGEHNSKGEESAVNESGHGRSRLPQVYGAKYKSIVSIRGDGQPLTQQ